MNLVLCYFSLLYLGCFMQTMMVVSTHINQTTYQCVRPTLELWNDELRNLFAQPRPLGCSQVETNWVYVDNSSLRIDQSAAALHGPINCHYIPIRRGRNDFEVSAVSEFSLQCCLSAKFYTKCSLPDEFLQLQNQNGLYVLDSLYDKCYPVWSWFGR